MKITQKSFFVGLALFIVGGIVGGMVFTRHYGVGPLATLSSRSSSAHNGIPCSQASQQWNYVVFQARNGNPAFNTNSVINRFWQEVWNCMPEPEEEELVSPLQQ